MSEAYSYAGAALLFLATLPQAWRLLKTRRADDLAWSFVLLNALGIALLLARSLEIRETAYVLLNASTLLFWTLVAGVKTTQRWALLARTPRGAPALQDATLRTPVRAP